jgi:hypothetical protein
MNAQNIPSGSPVSARERHRRFFIGLAEKGIKLVSRKTRARLDLSDVLDHIDSEPDSAFEPEPPFHIGDQIEI